MISLANINSFIILFSMILSSGLTAQRTFVNVSGIIRDKVSDEHMSFVNIQVKKQTDSSFVAGTISDDNGLFTVSDVSPGDYLLEVSFIGYRKYNKQIFVGSNSQFIDLGTIFLEEDSGRSLYFRE